MRCTSNYPFAKPVDMDIFLHSTHKREKVLIPRLLFILYDPYTFPPYYIRQLKKHTFFPIAISNASAESA